MNALSARLGTFFLCCFSLFFVSGSFVGGEGYRTNYLPYLTRNSSYSHPSSSNARCLSCGHDMLSIAAFDLAPLDFSLYPLATPIPFNGAPLIAGNSIAQTSASSFLLKEPGFYLLEATIYSEGTSVTNPTVEFGFLVTGSDGSEVLLRERIQDLASLQPFTIREIYEVNCHAPQTLQLVGYGTGVNFFPGRNVSLSVVKLCDYFPDECIDGEENCCPLLMATVTDHAPITIVNTAPTAYPFPDDPMIVKGKSICRYSDTLFKLCEPGYYMINVSLNARIESAFNYGLRVHDRFGNLIFEGEPQVQQGYFSTFPARYFYTVESEPVLIDIVLRSVGLPTAEVTFSPGGGVISIIKLREFSCSPATRCCARKKEDSWIAH